ncbi:MAG TPA: MATE family efflux transporter [Candidatus Fournierella excrementigallinarum]|nr:MATE family efflux transporter [Candidatus Fournierella excrementigallinarum]
MTNNDLTKNRFLAGPILPPLLWFAFPLMLSQLLQAFYGGVDLMVVGQYSSTASVSAVATGSQIMQALTVLVAGLTMGVTVLVGKAAGAGDADAAGRVVAGQLRLFALLAAALTAGMLAFAPAIVQWMNVPAEAVPETLRYVRICSGGIPFIAAYNGISGVFRGLGNSRSPFLFVLTACLVNVTLDLVFVGVFHLNASGAALATVIAQGSSVLFSLVCMRRHPLPFPVRGRRRDVPRAVGSILRLGAPIALQDFLTTISFLIITSIVNSLGLVASAGVGISEKLFVFLSIVPISFMSALSTFVAQNMGAGQPLRARQALFAAQKVSLCFGAAIFTLTFWGGGLLAALFSRDAAVIEAAALYMRGSAAEHLLNAFVYCMLGYFNGRERTAFVMAQGLFTAFLVRIPLSYLLSRLPGAGMLTISMAIPATALVSLALCAGYLLLLRRRDSAAGAAD